MIKCLYLLQVLVDGPETQVPRMQLRLNQLHLTKFRMKFPFSASTRVVRKVWKDNKIEEKWQESAWAKKLVAKEKVTTFLLSIVIINIIIAYTDIFR